MNDAGILAVAANQDQKFSSDNLFNRMEEMTCFTRSLMITSSSSSDRVDSRGLLRQPGVATTTSLRPFSTNAEGCTITDLLDP